MKRNVKPNKCKCTFDEIISRGGCECGYTTRECPRIEDKDLNDYMQKAFENYLKTTPNK